MEYGLIGQSIQHSYAKEFQESISPISYEIKSMEKEQYIDLLKRKDFKGINVTIPYKELSIDYLDKVDETVKETGAVNTIVNKDGKLIGYNLDLFGAYCNLKHSRIDVEDKTVLILGTGGTSKTYEYLMKRMKAKIIYKASRHPGEGTNDVKQITYEEAESIKDIEIVINTTPVGMHPHVDDDLLIDLFEFPRLRAVVDCIYNPYKTKLLMEAKRRNVKYVNGLMMMIGQGVKTNDLFMEKTHKRTTYLNAYLSLIARDVNIVLIGMPGSGKKTIAELLSKRLGMYCYHVDEEMEKRAGKKLADIILSHTEEEYRDLEAEAMRYLAKKKGKIISTASGVVLRDDNIKMIESNCIMIYVDRPMADVKKCLRKKRSTKVLETYHTLEEMEKVRTPLYLKHADYIVLNNGKADQVVEKIITKLKGDEVPEA